jgi:uncharacterized membrane protein
VSIFELGAFGASVLLWSGYHAYLRLQLRRDPFYTVQAVNRSARAAWAEHVMERDGGGLLAVQTLRNTTMAATFFSSTAVLLMIGTLSLTARIDTLSDIFHRLTFGGSVDPQLWTIKILLLLTNFFAAFFAFAMSVRLLSHVGYQISLPREVQTGVHSPAHVTASLNRAGRFYTLGMRAYYAAVPLVFWLFGPHFMLAATAITIVVLHYVDRAPQPSSD